MDTQRETYRAAYTEAAEELKMIHREIEELAIRREKMAKVIEALQPRLGSEAANETEDVTLTTRLAHATVVTRVAVTFGRCPA